MRDLFHVLRTERLTLEEVDSGGVRFWYGQSTENSTLSTPSAISVQTKAGVEKLPLQVTTRLRSSTASVARVRGGRRRDGCGH